MNRRDIIIIAVLINAGLLVVLFASALKSAGKPSEIVAESHAHAPSLSPIIVPDTPMVRGDEVDQVLSRFASVPHGEVAASTSLPPLPTQSLVSLPTVITPTAPSLADSAIAELPAVPPTPKQRDSATSWREWKVQKGDTLGKIAHRHKTSVDVLIEMNRLQSTKLRIGQVLKVPANTPVAAKVAPAYYIIQNGDTPWSIAKAHGIEVAELLALNELNEERACRLQIGSRIRVK